MTNSVAIVTGASQGIGRATAIRLSRDFSAVVIAAGNKQELRGTEATVKAAAAPKPSSTAWTSVSPRRPKL